MVERRPQEKRQLGVVGPHRGRLFEKVRCFLRSPLPDQVRRLGLQASGVSVRFGVWGVRLFRHSSSSAGSFSGPVFPRPAAAPESGQTNSV